MPDSLLAPGPVNLHPEVRRLLGLPMIHHRTPEFDAIFAKALSGLKSIFGTTENVFIHTATGSGGMESLIVNTLSPGDEVLSIVSGKFGERWADMAKTFGITVHVLKVPWGEAVKTEEVEKHLKIHPQVRAVLCQACETSTAVRHPIEEIAALIKNLPETLFLVDGITAVGAYPLPMDAWGIDGLVAGSQKAFMLPTGLSFVSFSKKAWAKIPDARCPRFYFDIRQEKKSNDKGESTFSANVPVIRALEWVVSEIQRHGLEAHYHTIDRRARWTRAFANEAGLGLFSQSPSASVTAILMPTGIDGQKIREDLEKNYSVTVIGGQDQAKGKILRVGHMGFIQDHEMMHLFRSLGHALAWPESKIASMTAAMKTWGEKNP